MKVLSLLRSLLIPAIAVAALAGSAAIAQETTLCPPMPGVYVKLFSQPYALCAGAATVNFNGVTYAKCTRMNGNSISLEQKYPTPNDGSYITVPLSGDVATVNQGSASSKGYVVSTYSPPSGAVLPRKDLAIYTCNQPDGHGGFGSYAQCDGGICFNSTTNSTSPLWGKVARNQVICSCPVIRGVDPFQVVGPGKCPTTAAEYDKVCGTAPESVAANGAVHFIGAPTQFGYASLSRCLRGTDVQFHTCDRPAN